MILHDSTIKPAFGGHKTQNWHTFGLFDPPYQYEN